MPTRRSTRTTSILNACLILAAALALQLLRPAGVVAQEDGLPLGATPEPVVLETLDGEPVDLGNLSGEKPVLLEFWATWCAICRALEPAMNAAHDAYGEDVEFVVVAAAVAQTRDQIREHLVRHPTPGRILWDTGGRFTRAFDAPGTGYIVILDPEGKVAYTGTGADQDLTAALSRVISAP